MSDDEEPRPQGPNYITPAGYQKLIDEQERLLTVERPKIVDEVATAAAHGDRSENAEYIYGKRKLRQIDSRLQWLNKRLDKIQVVDPKTQKGKVVLFGATVTVEGEDGREKTYQIVGVDEVDAAAGKVSWQSPLGRALLRRKVGDWVVVQKPSGEEELSIVRVVWR
ncbi:MAG: transcription elongation factor GreB [Deltaproteobacteria bacterium]|nr:transcription elongation factor GreB [Deltaproteobacteria bacterium]